MVTATHGADARRFLAGHHLGLDLLAAEVTKPRQMADAREAVRADCVQVALVQREIGTAEFALERPLGSRRPAMRAADDGRVVRLRLMHREHLAAVTAEPLANRQGRGVILPFAIWTGDE